MATLPVATDFLKPHQQEEIFLPKWCPNLGDADGMAGVRPLHKEHLGRSSEHSEPCKVSPPPAYLDSIISPGPLIKENCIFSHMILGEDKELVTK